MILELMAAVSKINDFKQVQKLSIKNEQVILKDSDGNVVELNTKRHRERISGSYKSTIDESDLGFTYKTKMRPLPLPELPKAKVELAQRIFTLARCPRKKESNQTAQMIYDLYTQGYNHVMAENPTKKILDLFGSNSAPSSDPGNNASNPDSDNNAPNSDSGNDVSNSDTDNNAPKSDSGNNAPNPDSGNNASNSDSGNEVSNSDSGNNAPNPNLNNNNNASNPEFSLSPFISDVQKLSTEEKEEKISQKAAVFQ